MVARSAWDRGERVQADRWLLRSAAVPAPRHSPRSGLLPMDGSGSCRADTPPALRPRSRSAVRAPQVLADRRSRLCRARRPPPRRNRPGCRLAGPRAVGGRPSRDFAHDADRSRVAANHAALPRMGTRTRVVALRPALAGRATFPFDPCCAARVRTTDRWRAGRSGRRRAQPRHRGRTRAARAGGSRPCSRAPRRR